uniref:Uncharacterized protein n=1 Tax=Cyprinus carpio TaxID=7962 RepID=A0A8C2HJY7_CYPCA
MKSSAAMFITAASQINSLAEVFTPLQSCDIFNAHPILLNQCEDEGGDPDNIEITLSAETPTRKHSKSKGRPSRSDPSSFI